MNGYVFMENLFRTVLTASPVIQGRFYVGHRYGLQDINYDELGQQIDEIKVSKKYPLAMMAPPHSILRIVDTSKQWETYRNRIYFATTTFYMDNKVVQPNTNMGTSEKQVPVHWDEMKAVAIQFLRDIRATQAPGFEFRLPPNEVLIIPFSKVGMDRVSGVSIAFDFQIFVQCVI